VGGRVRGRMKRWSSVALVALAALVSASCGGEKKKPVTRGDFQTVGEYINKTLTGGTHTADERKTYVTAQLGAPHRVEGPQRYWYTTKPGCYYLAMGEDGWVSWGTGDRAADCTKWAVTK
jgi:hypothetical protein